MSCTPEERERFVSLYKFFDTHSNPPANSDPDAAPWWERFGDDMRALLRNYPDGDTLVMKLVFAVFDYLEEKGRLKDEKTGKA